MNRHNFLFFFTACVLLVSCASNKDLVILPEWTNISANNNLPADFEELKWLDENNIETDTAEYMDSDGCKLSFEAAAKNLSESEEVFAYIYRNSAKDKDDYVQKIQCNVKEGKISGNILIKESSEFLATLQENDKAAYFFTVGSQISKPVKIEFAFRIILWDNPYKEVENQSYKLMDMNGGKKYNQRKYCNDDKIPVDERHYYLKFTNVKPGLLYEIRYILTGGSIGQSIYDNVTFAELMGE